MPTQPYKNAAGERRPGTTHVIGSNLGWSKDALMKWANREGLAGRKLYEDTKAADVGSLAHALVEAHIHSDGAAMDRIRTEATPHLLDPADEALKAYLRWERQTRGTIIATELWGVDEEYQTGWCLDALRLEEYAPVLTVLDWKTGKGTYAEHLIQVASYTVFAERSLSAYLGQDVRVDGAHLLRVSPSGNFTQHFWPRNRLDLGWKCFTWLRALHEVRPQVEALVR